MERPKRSNLNTSGYKVPSQIFDTIDETLKEYQKVLNDWVAYAESLEREVSDCKHDLDNQISAKLAKVDKEKSEKVTIPKFVAEYIENCKKVEFTLLEFLDLRDDEYEDIPNELAKKTRDWYCEDIIIRELMIARAWIDGYETEEEQLYYLVFPYISRMIDGKPVTIHNIKTGKTKDLAYDHFTEAEIKEIDPCYWPFAVPVEV